MAAALLRTFAGFGNKQRRLNRLKIHQSVSDVSATDTFPTQAAKRIRFKRKTDSWVSPPIIGYHEWQLLKNSQLHYESPTMLVVAGQAASAGTTASSGTNVVPAAKHSQVNNASSQVSTAVSQSPETSPRYTTPADSLSPIIPYMVVDLLSTSVATPRPRTASGLDGITQTPQPQRLTADIKSVHLPNVTEFLKQFAPVLPLLSGLVKVMRSNEPAPVQMASNLPLDVFQRSDENSPTVPLKLTGAASGPAPHIFASPIAEKSNTHENIIKDFSIAVAAITELTPTTGAALQTHSVFPEKMETNNSTTRHILNIKKIPKNNFGIERAPKRTHQSSFAHLPSSSANIEKVGITDRLQQLTLRAYQQVDDSDKGTMGAQGNSKKKTRKFASNMQRDHFSYDESSAHHRMSEIRQANWKTVRSGTAERIRSMTYADRLFTESSQMSHRITQTSTVPMRIFVKKYLNHSKNALKNLSHETIGNLTMLRNIPNLDKLIDGMDLNLLNQPGGFAHLKQMFIERILRQQNSTSLSSVRPLHLSAPVILPYSQSRQELFDQTEVATSSGT